ncbi:MAG: prepilin-type N-terminal cleavage/methylation domain-containing protein [Candidatus Omnitrophica bacterium]|nr:prepilin-type N-terminal cleavage/methylation domain-containing protein [Candidatus Omnitrophota bacterium]
MRRAFTLVELIVVVIIIGILLSVGIPQYRKALERSRGAEAYAGLAHIQQGEKVYFASNEKYYNTTNNPASKSAPRAMPIADTTALDITLPQVGWYFNVSCSDVSRDFEATAYRLSGPCGTCLITIDENGTQSEIWKGHDVG